MSLVQMVFTSRYFSIQQNLRVKSHLSSPEFKQRVCLPGLGFSEFDLKTILTLRQPFKIKAGEGNLFILVLNAAFVETADCHIGGNS